MTRRALLVAVLLSGCSTPSAQYSATKIVPSVSVDPAPAPVEWRRIANESDQHAIDVLRQQWDAALDAAAARNVAGLRAEGPLLDPAAAQPQPALPPGPYRCRLVRLGGRAGYATYRPDYCYVDGDDERTSLTKQDGKSLPGGWLYTDTDNRRLVFLGTNRLRPADVAPGYGQLPGREVAGVIERVGPFRWRLVLSRPMNPAAEVELFELVPVPPPPPEIGGPAPPTSPVSFSRRRSPRG